VATFHLLSPGAIQWLGNTTQLYILWILYLLVAGALAVATRDRNGPGAVAPLIAVAISFAAAALIGRQLAHYIAAGIAAPAMALAVMAPLKRPPA
jgi:hypothetical protein